MNFPQQNPVKKKGFDFKQQLNKLNQEFEQFATFISGKLKNFKNLSLGEQISYPSIGVGVLLIMTSIVLFIV